MSTVKSATVTEALAGVASVRRAVVAVTGCERYRRTAVIVVHTASRAIGAAARPAQRSGGGLDVPGEPGASRDGDQRIAAVDGRRSQPGRDPIHRHVVALMLLVRASVLRP